jgi:hypothetical protein
MSLIDLYAMDASYQNDKVSYDQLLNNLHHSPAAKKDISGNVFLASQMNADLQTSLLAMSNKLSPESKKQYQLLAASKNLEEQYTQLVGDSRTITDMQCARFFAWGLGAIVVLFALFRASNAANTSS